MISDGRAELHYSYTNIRTLFLMSIMTTKMDDELIFAPLHAIFVFVLIGFIAMALLFSFIAFVALS